MVIPGNKNCAIRNIHWLEKANTNNSQTVDTNPLYVNGLPRRLVTTGINGVVIEWDFLSQ